MRVLRFCLVALIAALLVVGQAAPALPIPSLPAAEAVAVQAGVAGQCGGEPVLVALLSVGGRLFTLATDGRAFLLYDNADGDETDAWLGTVGPDGRLVVRAYLTFKQLTARFASPCAALSQQGV